MSNTISGARGITFSGETFTVPQTHDMVKTLFDPTIRKSLFEKVIVFGLIFNFSFIFWFSNSIRIDYFIAGYLFWRFAYDFGIGYLLYNQSKYNKMVNWAKKLQVFEVGSNSWLARLIRYEISSQMGTKYSINDYPIEFNTWLVFRKVVDLILMNDFVFFMGLFVVCSIDKDYQFINFDQQPAWLVYFRLIVGPILILFNYWVKNDAHNVIKDYAWYWGDFFFRQINNEDLIFDGVFEMVPHPMYSIGYIGYYGFALIAKSYTVLILACIGHFLQMIFLHFIENPHIDKIYGPSVVEVDLGKLIKLKDLKYFRHLKPLIGFYNFNIQRGSDIVNLILIVTYSGLLPFLFYVLKSTDTTSVFSICFDTTKIFFFLTLTLKVAESVFINSLLFCQSYYKSFTKYYLVNDIPIEDSLNNFAVIYNSFISLSYSSLVGLNIYFFMTGLNRVDLFFESYYYLRIFVGVLLILTQIFINQSIVDSIGYFGWFYGDFFIPKNPNSLSLTKAGVYRYLNNPEQIFGVCSLMGIFLIIPNFENLVLCGLWIGNNFARINFIEKFHMIKLYGKEEVLKDSGVTKTLKSLIPASRRSSTSSSANKKIFHERKNSNSIILNASETIDQIIKEFKKSNKKLTKQNIFDISQNLYFENSDYKLTLTNLKFNDDNDNNLIKYIEVGENINVEFHCPANHSPKDWIGLYKIVQTGYNRYKTLISSNNRWEWVPENKDSGVLSFAKDKLFWDEGIFEFRYHLDGKHDVAYISEPFEIKVPSIQVPSDTEGIYTFAKELKERVIDRVILMSDINENIIAKTESGYNGSILETYNRLSNLVSLATQIQVSNKIFLHPEELSILHLSSKIVHMKKVLDDLSFEKSIPAEKKDQ
ncbi:hypothetical protein CANTEDRAFT_93448 [Yamadazyma tenuis ATCC 10573]|uniref:Phosphatidylethanolamine N-methyltransferase n=1 Tax=Candida tenuis (strain ATCC 10573 / BCRC 21748 / CBS 615 / JCM 9827 / NBRC 10315 / NRRL Y-1498 / VKM Y-70) TaxID=590646 RepID=G3B4B5_CANTC|nr:uncharacterized protein CANTEDRAFT_93448 [Yamadazyma tenuis ATCC 10573]EGV63941.1 hypothetical protein CANTEDRAFT_93448 [Yamadazyma tenuis ATCC 10573]